MQKSSGLKLILDKGTEFQGSVEEKKVILHTPFSVNSRILLENTLVLVISMKPAAVVTNIHLNDNDAHEILG